MASSTDLQVMSPKPRALEDPAFTAGEYDVAADLERLIEESMSKDIAETSSASAGTGLKRSGPPPTMPPPTFPPVPPEAQVQPSQTHVPIAGPQDFGNEGAAGGHSCDTKDTSNNVSPGQARAFKKMKTLFSTPPRNLERDGTAGTDRNAIPLHLVGQADEEARASTLRSPAIGLSPGERAELPIGK